MAIYEPERVWWKPLSKDERLWVSLALIWMLVSFFFMPIYHLVGAQNPPAETYSVSAGAFDKLLERMAGAEQRDARGTLVLSLVFLAVSPVPGARCRAPSTRGSIAARRRTSRRVKGGVKNS